MANCFTWIKADPTFEGLRQAVIEYPTRIQISEHPPLEPLLQIKGVKLDFPPTTELRREDRSDSFCFRGTFNFHFSPYLTCIIGGRGSGKSTLLNLIHEKLDPKSTEFFKDNSLTPREAAVETAVTVDGVSEVKVVEFLQQNEIEQFASDHKRLTSAIFTRLRKLDGRGVLKEREGAIDGAVQMVADQIVRVVAHYETSAKLTEAEKELATQRGLVESFQNTDYKRINDELGSSNRQLQNLRTSKTRLNNLMQEVSKVLKSYAPAPIVVGTLSELEEQTRKTVQAIQQALDDAVVHASLRRAEAREHIISSAINKLRAELDAFLKERGLSAENQSDVGKASERIAELEDELTSFRGRVDSLQNEINSFTPQREQSGLYVTAVEELLSPINAELKGLSSEVKPIELKYTFNTKAFRDVMISYVANAIGQVEGRAAREDYVDAKLKDLDFSALPDRDSAMNNIPDDSTVYGKILREYFGQGVNYELLQLEAERTHLDFRNWGKFTFSMMTSPWKTLLSANGVPPSLSYSCYLVTCLL